MSFINYLQSQGKSKSTVKHYNTYILDFISYLDADNTAIENTTAKEVLSFLKHLQRKGQENKTRNIRLNVIKHFFNWQIETGNRTDNPVAHLKIRGSKKQKLYPLLSKQELEAIYINYEAPTNQHKKSRYSWFKAHQLSKHRNKVILSLFINQGLTTPELERLRLNDLKLKEGKIYIQGSRKTNKRTLELKSNQIIELMEYQYTTRLEFLKYQEAETKRLFLSLPTAGQEKSNNSLQIWKSLSKAIKEQDSKFINFKQVRTSVITHWLKQYNLRQVQYMAGHRYISSTESYLVNQTEDLQKDIDNFHPM
jgi:site-specific recombinase XerD